MTDTDEQAVVNDPDPIRFMSTSEVNKFWFELVLRDLGGKYEVKLTEVTGRVKVEDDTLTAEEFDKTLASALEHMAEVIRGGRQVNGKGE